MVLTSTVVRNNNLCKILVNKILRTNCSHYMWDADWAGDCTALDDVFKQRQNMTGAHCFNNFEMPPSPSKQPAKQPASRMDDRNYFMFTKECALDDGFLLPTTYSDYLRTLDGQESLIIAAVECARICFCLSRRTDICNVRTEIFVAAAACKNHHFTWTCHRRRPSPR